MSSDKSLSFPRTSLFNVVAASLNMPGIEGSCPGCFHENDSFPTHNSRNQLTSQEAQRRRTLLINVINEALEIADSIIDEDISQNTEHYPAQVSQ